MESNIEKKPKKEKGKRKKLKIFLIITAVILILAILAALWWVFFGKKPAFTGDNISFNLVGPAEIVSGEIATYNIDYINNEDTDLENVEISMIYPDGFLFKSSVPKSTSFNDNKWQLETIKAGESGSIVIKGSLFGEVGGSITAVANLSYKPANFNSTFTERSEAKTGINALSLDLNVDMPQSVQKDSKFEYSISIKNSTGNDVENIRIEADFPDNYEFISSAPAKKVADSWDILKLKPGEKKEIKIVGKITGEVGDIRNFKTRCGLFDEQNNFYLQQEQEDSVRLADIAGEVKMQINGTEKNSAKPGDLLEYTITYRNTGSVNLKDIVVELEVEDGSLINGSTVLAGQGVYKDGKVTWTYENINELKSLDPEQGGTFVFRANIVSPILVGNVDDKEFSIKAKSKMKGKKGDSKEEIEVIGNTTETKIVTEVIFKAEARYYSSDSEPVGTGPLPPKVGEKTTYKIYLSLTNRTNDIENSRAEIYLGNSASWTGIKNVNVGDLKFESGKVIWDIGKIPANTGQFTNNLEADFELSILPSSQDVGKTIELINNILFTGSDAFTNDGLEVQLGSLDTNLEKDILAKDKAEVVE